MAVGGTGVVTAVDAGVTGTVGTGVGIAVAVGVGAAGTAVAGGSGEETGIGVGGGGSGSASRMPVTYTAANATPAITMKVKPARSSDRGFPLDGRLRPEGSTKTRRTSIVPVLSTMNRSTPGLPLNRPAGWKESLMS
jgi:hypothetical protein